MCVLTYCTLRCNNRQLNELKRQWNEEHRPKLEILLVEPWGLRTESVCLEIRNIGKDVAHNVKIDVADVFFQTIGIESVKKDFEIKHNREYTILPGEALHLNLCEINWDNQYSIHGTEVALSEFEQLLDRLSELKFVVQCYFSDNYTVGRTLCTKDKQKRHTTIQEELSQINWQLCSVVSEVKKTDNKDQ